MIIFDLTFLVIVGSEFKKACALIFYDFLNRKTTEKEKNNSFILKIKCIVANGYIMYLKPVLIQTIFSLPLA